MSVPDATWQSLPEHFKRSVIEKLDLKSRFALCRCSREDHRLVTTCSISLESFEIFFPPAKGVILKVQESLDWNTRKTLRFPAVPDVVRFFQLPHLEIQNLIILSSESRFYQITHLTSQLAALMKKDENLKIRVKSLYWRCTPEDKADDFIRFLVLLDVEFLEVIHNDMCRFSMEQMEQLVKMEQWKKVKEVHLENGKVESVDQFLMVERCTVLFEKLIAEHIWKMIQSFLSRDVPVGSSFHFQSEDPPKLVDVFNTYKVPAKHEPIVPDDIGVVGRHTQRFEMTAGKFLAIRNTEVGVRGDVMVEEG